MPYRLEINDWLLWARTGPAVTASERCSLIDDIAATAAREAPHAVVIDHSGSALTLAWAEAQRFGEALGEGLRALGKLPLFVLVDRDSPALGQIDLAVTVARGFGLHISCFTDSDLLLEQVGMLQAVRFEEPR